MRFRGGEVQIDPPSISWFSSTPAEIGLRKRVNGILSIPRCKELEAFPIHRGNLCLVKYELYIHAFVSGILSKCLILPIPD